MYIHTIYRYQNSGNLIAGDTRYKSFVFVSASYKGISYFEKLFRCSLNYIQTLNVLITPSVIAQLKGLRKTMLF